MFGETWFGKWLANHPWFLLGMLFGSIVSGGGFSIVNKIYPQARSDPWTGTMDKETMSNYYRKREVDLLIQDIRAIDLATSEKLEHLHRDFTQCRERQEAHLKRGEAGFSRIDRLEKDQMELKEDIRNCCWIRRQKL